MTLDEKRLAKVRNLLKKPRTVKEIAFEIGADIRTIYRYLHILKSRGLSVHRVGIRRPTYYKINA